MKAHSSPLFFPMREWINQNGRLITIASVVVVAGAAAWFFSGGGAGGAGSSGDIVTADTWYYDVETGESFRAPWRQVPPIKSPAGNEAARVIYFSCGGCGVDERFAGYYLKYSPEFKKRADADSRLFNATFGEQCPGRLFSTDGKTWIAAPSPDAAGVLEHFRNRCKDGVLRRCP